MKTVPTITTALLLFLLATPSVIAKSPRDEFCSRINEWDPHMQTEQIGSIPIESEYIIFIIDTSGSMIRYAWPKVIEQLLKTLTVYPKLKGIQIMNDMGTYMFPNTRGQWIPDMPERRRAIIDRLCTWRASSNGSPVEGITAAIRSFYSADKKISLYFYGDEFTRDSIRKAIVHVDSINPKDAEGNPLVRIHASGFPVQFANPPELQATGIKFAALMRELTGRNGGTFVGLNSFKPVEIDRNNVRARNYEQSRDVPTFVGKGNREYLTGIRLGGRRILILLDASASMLDETIVNVSRRRNMDDAAKRRSAKWRQALATVDWISARFPQQSQYQIYTFNTNASPVLSDTRGHWLPVSNINELKRAIDEVKQEIPEGGSNLDSALHVITQLNPRPDNVYLITDGLPTLGRTPPSSTTVFPRERLRHFEEAVTRIPFGIPVNVILLPMKGDLMAASAFWNLALYTQGWFLTPAVDWP